MKAYDLEKVRADAMEYMKTQNTPVTMETVAQRINIQRKVVRYVFKSNTDVFKGRKKILFAKRYVYTL